jgi:hypothetical protein
MAARNGLSTVPREFLVNERIELAERVGFELSRLL